MVFLEADGMASQAFSIGNYDVGNPGECVLIEMGLFPYNTCILSIIFSVNHLPAKNNILRKQIPLEVRLGISRKYGQ